VFVSDDPHDGVVVKVLDFGIARASTMETTEPSQEAATGSSRVFGTPTYMAPEIAFGEPADGRSDLYSLGVVAYRMLTGQLPFEGDVPYLVISRHANEPPAALRSLEPSIPRGVEQVVLKALAKRPGDRFQSMASFARALAAIDEAGHGEVPAALLLETETAVAGPRTEPVSRASRAQRESRTSVTPAPEAEPRDEAPRRGASESSDGGTPRTDLGTERLPAKRRVTGVSDIVSVGRTGFTERIDGEGDEDDEPSARRSRELEAREDVDPTVVPPTRPPTPPPTNQWRGLVRMLGLLGLVALAAAVGALVARQQGPRRSSPWWRSKRSHAHPLRWERWPARPGLRPRVLRTAMSGSRRPTTPAPRRPRALPPPTPTPRRPRRHPSTTPPPAISRRGAPRPRGPRRVGPPTHA
jgi:serine/threonine protein kinase